MGKYKLDDIDFIEDEINKIKVTSTKKSTHKKGKKDMNKEQYKKAKAEHNAQIAKLKQDIQRHKLLNKQAKLTYKITQMKARI